jgi:hypothetical protein
MEICLNLFLRVTVCRPSKFLNKREVFVKLHTSVVSLNPILPLYFSAPYHLQCHRVSHTETPDPVAQINFCMVKDIRNQSNSVENQVIDS